jgi:hypothetical protein
MVSFNATPNNSMHPTRDALPLINLKRACGRVMPGVMPYPFKLLENYASENLESHLN